MRLKKTFIPVLAFYPGGDARGSQLIGGVSNDLIDYYQGFFHVPVKLIVVNPVDNTCVVHDLKLNRRSQHLLASQGFPEEFCLMPTNEDFSTQFDTSIPDAELADYNADATLQMCWLETYTNEHTEVFLAGTVQFHRHYQIENNKLSVAVKTVDPVINVNVDAPAAPALPVGAAQQSGEVMFPYQFTE